MHPNDVTLGDYLDGTLSSSARSEVDQHLAGCIECRELVADLREVGQAVAALGLMKPPERTWVRIADAMAHGRTAGRRGAERHLGWWMAAAAALVLATLAGWQIARPVPGPETTVTGGSPTAQPVEIELVQAEQHYQEAISALEQIANAERGVLDPETAATLATGLAVVDRAIGESRAALTAQPQSEPAQASLLENFKTKIALLDETVALINDTRKSEGT